jgi:Na+:H+ antiporter, NhaA family
MSKLPPSWLTSERPVPRRLVRPLREYLATETAGAVVLIVAAGVALLWANSPFGDSYDDLWNTRLSIRLGDAVVGETLRHWVDDGLMTLFFFVVGLEIKRELVVGELNDPRKAATPVIAALGGMIVPAAIYLTITVGHAGSRGWGIPMATDIAFALGVLALLGRRAPSTLRVFLLTLAIVDDIGTILVIALFYSGSLSLGWLAAAAGLLVVMALMRSVRIRYVPVYVLVGVAAWFATLQSGVHATIAGVAIALLTPARPLKESEEVTEFETSASAGETRRQILNLRETVSPAERLAHLLHPWTSFVVLPIFALANAGIRLSFDELAEAATSRVAIGVVLGLVVGKTIGVSGAVWLARATGIATLPEGVTTRQLLAVASVAGIGFTVSLFITSLAFSGAELVADAKIGILAASLLAAIQAYLILRTGPAPDDASTRDN